MARTSKITPELVAEVAERLQAQGVDPTNKAVLAEIGGGSMSTLVPLLAAWRAARAEREDLAEVEVPDQITAAGEQLISRIWRESMKEASAGHDALRKELLATQSEIDKLRAEMIELLRGVEAERDQARLEAEDYCRITGEARVETRAQTDRAVTAERELAAMSERANALSVENARLLEAAGRAREEINALREHNGQLMGQLSEVRESLASLTAERDGLRQSVNDLRAQSERDAARVVKAESKLDSQDQELRVIRTELNDRRAELVQERATLQTYVDRLERASVDLEQAQDENTALKQKITELEAKLQAEPAK